MLRTILKKNEKKQKIRSDSAKNMDLQGGAEPHLNRSHRKTCYTLLDPSKRKREISNMSPAFPPGNYSDSQLQDWAEWLKD